MWAGTHFTHARPYGVRANEFEDYLDVLFDYLLTTISQRVTKIFQVEVFFENTQFSFFNI